MKKGVLQNFAKFTEKYLLRSVFSNKVAGCNFIKNETQIQVFRCFPVKFVKHLRWLPLTGHKIARSRSIDGFFVRLREILLFSL